MLWFYESIVSQVQNLSSRTNCQQPGIDFKLISLQLQKRQKNLALVSNVDQRRPVPKCEATITDRVPHLVRNSTVGNLLIDPCTSVEDKNSTEAIRMWGLFFSSLPRSLGSTCVNNSYNWAAHKVGREAGHREVFQQIRSQLSDLPRFQAVPRCRACRIPPWTAGR